MADERPDTGAAQDGPGDDSGHRATSPGAADGSDEQRAPGGDDVREADPVQGQSEERGAGDVERATSAPPIPPANRATAQPPPLARVPRILDRLRDEVRRRGLVGEETNAQVLYLAMTSRLLDKQVSAGVKGHSASGKSYTVETVVKFFPKEASIVMTAMSERALIYSDEDYKHRTLIVYEVVALREGSEDNLTSYLVRSLLSEGRIEYPVTVRDKEGGFTTRTIVKEGPTNLIFTTTKTRVHAENETRVLSLNTDDSSEQTARVFRELAIEDRGDDDLTEWHKLQRWLERGEHRVTIPYAGRLAELVPPVAVRLRRDFGAVLALIRAHAMLHQATRERDDAGRVVAVLDDYAQVRELIADVVAEGLGASVSETVRETVKAVEKLARDRSEGVQARAVAEHMNLDKSNVSRRLRKAADEGYVRNLEDKRGQPGRWVVGEPMPEDTDVLPHPEQLSAPAGEDDAAAEFVDPRTGCAVAPVREGIGGEPRVVAPTPEGRPHQRAISPPPARPAERRCVDCGAPATCSDRDGAERCAECVSWNQPELVASGGRP